MPSSLDLLQFQPIRFGFVAETCANNDNREYCILAQDGDYINWQLRRTLGTSLGCDLSVSATEEVANPDFTGSAASWTLTGGGAPSWAYNANTVRITGGAAGVVEQNIINPVDKAIYQVTIVTTVTTSGNDLLVELSGINIGTLIDGTLAGTYIFSGLLDIADPTVRVGVSGAGLTCTVDSFHVHRAAECLTVDVVTGTFAYDETNGISINGTVNITATLPFEPASVYSPKTTMDINSLDGGMVEIVYDGTSSGSIKVSNGEYNYTANGTAYTTLGIGFTGFAGNISAMSFEQLSSDYYFAIYDLDGNYIQAINSSVDYCEEHIIVSLDPEAEGLEYGCYQIGLYDPYLHTDHGEYDYDFTTLGAAWATSSGTVWALTGGVGEEFTPGSANGSLSTSEANTDRIFAWVKLRFETGNITGGGAATMGLILSDGATNPMAGLSQAAPADDTIYASATEMDADVSWSALGSVKPALSLVGGVGGDNFIWKNAFYKVYPYHLDYLSNCFSFKETQPCTKLVQYNTGDNISFNNCEVFYMRFRNLRINPAYNIKASDFIASDGTRVLVSGAMQKVYTLLFDYMNELGHDVVAAILMSKTVYIGTDLATISSAPRYFMLAQDYTPEWEKDGKLNLAMGRVQMIEYNQVKFTTNCG